MMVGGKGTKTGSLSGLQCPDIARVHLVKNADGTKLFTMVQTGKKYAEDMQRARDAMTEKEMAAPVMRTAKQAHRSNTTLVNASVEQTTRANGLKTAMASFMGLEEDQLRDAKEKHEDGMPPFAISHGWRWKNERIQGTHTMTQTMAQNNCMAHTHTRQYMGSMSSVGE